MWFVALQPGQEQPCDCFDHADNIVHMGKTIAQKGAHVLKDGIGHKDVYAIAVGDITKSYFIPQQQHFAMGSLAQISSGAIRCSFNTRLWLWAYRRFRGRHEGQVPEGSGAEPGGRVWKVPVQ